MTLKHFISRFKKERNFRKRTIVISIISIVGILSLIFLVKNTNDTLFASVIRVNSRVFTKNTCNDTDGGIVYSDKWTITVVENWNTRIETDTCNSNGTLRERFCGQAGDPAGLLRSENYVDCGSESWCYQWTCKSCYAPEIILACNLNLPDCPSQCIITWNIIKDVMITSGSFVATDNQHALFTIEAKNIGNIPMPLDARWHTLYMNNIALPMWGNYTIQPLTSITTTINPNQTYTFLAFMTLENNLTFSSDAFLDTSVSTYPTTDDDPTNNTNYMIYLTGSFMIPPTTK